MTTFREENQRDRNSSMPGCQPALPGHSIQSYEEQHTWIIDQVLLPCTLAEYHCLELLFEHANACVPFVSFLSHPKIFPTANADAKDAKQERLRVAYLMSKLRTKVWAFGFDIASVWNIGYMLLSESQKRPSSEGSTFPPDNHSS